MDISQRRRRQLLRRQKSPFLSLQKQVVGVAVGILLASPQGRQLLHAIRSGSIRAFRYLVRISFLVVLRSATRSFHVLRSASEFVYKAILSPTPLRSSTPMAEHPVPLRPNPIFASKTGKKNSIPPLPSDVADKILSGVSGFSFEACSWLMFYHIGVARALVDAFGKEALAGSKNSSTNDTIHDARPTIGFGGTSSGSLVAAALAIGIDLEEFETFAFGMVDNYATAFCGPVGFMSKIVRGGLEQLVVGDAQGVDRVNQHDGRLVVSVTSLRDLLPSNRLITGKALGRTNKELFTTLLSSCYIPVYYEDPTVFVDDDGTPVIALDGGVTNRCPPVVVGTSKPGSCDQDQTVRVSPYRRLGKIEQFQIASPSSRAAYPFHLAIAPTYRHDYEELLRDGYEDACTWIMGQVQALVPVVENCPLGDFNQD